MSDSLKPDQTKAGLEQLGMEMWLHPLTRRYADRSRLTRNNAIRTPEDVLGERLFRLGGLALSEVRLPEYTYMNIAPEDRMQMVIHVIRAGLRATPYLWSDEVRMGIKMSLPDHVVSRSVMPGPILWFTFELAVQVGPNSTISDEKGRTWQGYDLDALLLIDHSDYIEIVTFGQIGDWKEPGTPIDLSDLETTRPTVEGSRLDYGTRYPDDFKPGGSAAGVDVSVLALLGFLNSPYIPKEQRKPSRAARRECARQGVEADEEVTFVILRRPEPGKARDRIESEPTEWKHQWIVSGHYRAQWYPSEQAHHLIWIAPYVKGPEDAPLLTHAYKVAR